jgi:DNA-binding transcriptional ArsR family regulator
MQVCRSVEAFGVLGDPVRRRILELLAGGEQPAGDVAAAIRGEFGLTQPAVSRHLRVLRESRFATVRSDGTRRLYALDATGLDHAQGWLADLRGQWSQRLDALDTELARGRHRTRTTAKHKEDAA